MTSPTPPQRGDESRLFELHNDELMDRVAHAVRTSPEIVQDACSHAWNQFLIYQPDRDRNWRGWLFTTAQREAWRLHGERETLRPMMARSSDGALVDVEPVDPRDRHAESLRFDDALNLLGELPLRLRRIAFLRAAGFRYAEISEITGDSRSRVTHLVTRANERLNALTTQTRSDAPDDRPRVRRLQELESSPPQWLVAEIRPVPTNKGGRVACGARVLAWRRAAVAIDDSRALTGFSSETVGLGERPADTRLARFFDLAHRSIEAVLHGVDRGRDLCGG